MSKMKAQQPAEGILKSGEWTDAVAYLVPCTCGCDDHAHRVWVEADDTDTVVVTTYTQQKTRWWELSRWRIIWRLLTTGYVEYEASIIMNPQQALNYAETVKSAVAKFDKKSSE
jgi:hypothetical protein